MSAQTNPLSYNDAITAIATLAVVNVHTVGSVVVGNNDAAFDALIPSMLDYAEGRIQRDLDLLPSQISLSYTLTANSNQLQISPNDFVTIQTITTANGPLLPVTKEFLQNVYPNVNGATYPQYFAMVGGDQATGGVTWNNVMLGPWPDSNYPITVTGTQRLPSLYKFANATDAANKYTFISTWLPELLIQASMIYVAQYQRNFGPSMETNDPGMPGSYESQYQTLLRGAVAEEYRKKFEGSAWSSYSAPIGATLGR